MRGPANVTAVVDSAGAARVLETPWSNERIAAEGAIEVRAVTFDRDRLRVEVGLSRAGRLLADPTLRDVATGRVDQWHRRRVASQRDVRPAGPAG